MAPMKTALILLFVALALAACNAERWNGQVSIHPDMEQDL